MAVQKRDFNHVLRFVMLGDFEVGKSSLLRRLIPDNQPTGIGIDFRCRTLLACGKKVRLQVWDTDGQERFRAIPNYYFEKVCAVLLVYDITSRESFYDIKNFWVKEVEESAGIGVHMALVGNKSDLEEQRAVPAEQAMAFAKENGMIFMEGSSKTGENMESLLSLLTDSVVRQLENTEGKKQQISRMTLKSSAISRGDQARSSCF